MAPTENPSKGICGRCFSNEYGMLAYVWPQWQQLLESNISCRCCGNLGTVKCRMVSTILTTLLILLNLVAVLSVMSAMLLVNYNYPMVASDTYSIGLQRFRQSSPTQDLKDFAVDCPNDAIISSNACTKCLSVTEFPFVAIALHIPFLPWLLWKQLQRTTEFGDYNCNKNLLTIVHTVLCLLNSTAAGVWFQLCYRNLGATVTLRTGSQIWIVSIVLGILTILFNILLSTPAGRRDASPEPYFVDYLMKQIAGATIRSPRMEMQSVGSIMDKSRESVEDFEHISIHEVDALADYKNVQFRDLPPSPTNLSVQDPSPRPVSQIGDYQSSELFVYVDQKGLIRGPQPLRVLQDWYLLGKVPPTLIVRRVDWNAWVTLPTVLWGKDIEKGTDR
eukprot:GEMP01027295.1.p1 GENE.GEMP01027295.1~~GEMP01027295.1.p1  ORF type:complete len:390 (+),score=51.95 GEMP01027295.1:173-1342(+)